MKRIPLTKGKSAIVDDEDYEGLSKYKWWTMESRGRFYACRWKSGKHVFMHKEILGITGKGDHQNNDSLDNRRCNLREATTQKNNWNTRKRKATSGKPVTSQFKGVCLVGKKWRARVVYNGVKHHLGHFGNEVEAARVYDAKAKELFGEFAWLNFPQAA